MKFAYNGITLVVPDSVYYPEEDSLLLAEAVSEMATKDRAFLEMGCGAGLSSVMAAKKGAIVTAADINDEAVKATKENGKANGVSLNVVNSDLFSSIKGRFDIIAFNPPYLPADEDDRHLGGAKTQLIGGTTGRETIVQVLKEANTRLKKGGKILLLISSLTGEKEVRGICNKLGYQPSALKRKNIEWEELIILRLAYV